MLGATQGLNDIGINKTKHYSITEFYDIIVIFQTVV